MRYVTASLRGCNTSVRLSRRATGGVFFAPMPRSLLPVLAFAAFAACAANGAAQERPELQIRNFRTLDDLKTGARLRVLMADSTDRMEGHLRGFGQTSLSLEVRGTPRDLPISSIVIVDEAYRDRKRGALAGALVAVLGVYVYDFFGPGPKYENQDTRYRENITALAISVPVMALVGGAIGWPRWRPISTSAR
jgi:hypothetical protein